MNIQVEKLETTIKLSFFCEKNYREIINLPVAMADPADCI